MSNKNARLDHVLSRSGIVVVSGAADGLGARLVELAGFDAVDMSGFATAGSMGKADVGVLSMSEVLERARQITDVVDIPLIADTDNGYGNAVNVVRTVREFERAGVSAIQLEDQASPKKCGSAAGKEIIPLTEMVGKIKAAMETLLEIKKTGDSRHLMEHMVSFTEFNNIVGMKDVMAIEEAYKG